MSTFVGNLGNHNCMYQCIRWFQEDAVPTYQKVTTAVLLAFASLSVLFCIGYFISPALGVVTVIIGGFSLLFWGAIEADNIAEDKQRVARQQETNAALTELQKKKTYLVSLLHVNGIEYDKLPEIITDKFSTQSGLSSIIGPWWKRLSAQDLSNPMMRGETDRIFSAFGNTPPIPFIAIKVEDTQRRNTPCVLIAYLGTLGLGAWGVCFPGEDKLEKDVQSVFVDLLSNNGNRRFKLIT